MKTPLESKAGQLKARQLVRKSSGVRSVIQALNYSRSLQHIDMIRASVMLVLLGLAQDKGISDLLEKMGLSSSLVYLMQSSDEQQFRTRSSKGTDKYYLVFRAFVGQLIALLTPSPVDGYRPTLHGNPGR